MSYSYFIPLVVGQIPRSHPACMSIGMVHESRCEPARGRDGHPGNRDSRSRHRDGITPQQRPNTLPQLTLRSEQGGACECDQVPHQPDPHPGGGVRRRAQGDGSLPHPVRAAAGGRGGGDGRTGRDGGV